MADPRLNSLHLEPVRRQEYRHARDVLLRARGDQTIYATRDSDSQNFGHTAIHQVGVNTVGRSSDNDVVLDDPYASRRHCAILVHSDKTCELHDTASKNGTCVNGARLAGPIVLKAGDEIRISHLQFVFLTRDAGPDASPSATLGV